MKVMRPRPDVEEDQRPEVDDRKPVGIDRPLRPLRDEVVHDGQEAGGEEEADRVVAVPPLNHGVLHAGPDDVGLRREQRHRDRRVVAEMKDGDRQDEGEVEPVRDIDVRLGAPHDRAEIHQQIDHPDDGQPQVGVPFGFRIFFRLRDSEQIAGAGDHDEEVVAQDDEPGRDIAHQPCAAGPLDDIERRADQHIAAEGENHRRRVQWPDAAERQPRQIEIEHRKGEFERGPQPDGEAGDAPHDRRDGGELHRSEIVVGPPIDGLRRQAGGPIVVPIDDCKHGSDTADQEQKGMKRVFWRMRIGCNDQRQARKRCQGQRRAALSQSH